MKERNKILLLLFTSGILTGLSVAFSKYLGFIEWVSLIPFILALKRISENESISKRKAYAYGLFYFECFFAVCFHWFAALYPLDFTGLDNFESAIVIFLAVFGLAFLQALFGGFVFVIYVATARSALAKRLPAIKLFAIVPIYTVFEFSSTLGWWGVPWGRLSIGQVDAVLPSAIASVLGSYAVSAVIILVNSLLAFAIDSAKEIAKSRRYAFSALSVFLINLALGGILTARAEVKANGAPTVRMAVVQANFSSGEKWSVSLNKIVDRHLELTEAAIADGAELIVWPETALPITLYENSVNSLRISALAEASGVTVIVGAIHREDGNEYNALFCYTPDGERSETVYKKRHLVPFGEYVPMRSFIEAIVPFMSEISMLSSDMTAGEDAEIFSVDGVSVGSLICFDSIYETLTLDTVREGAQLLVISTNDSWFTDSAAIYMHENQARLRAIESGRYIARSANTGISSFISSSGIELDTIPPLKSGYITQDVPQLSYKTVYSVIGNLFVYLSLASLFAPVIYSIATKLASKNGDNENNT